MGLRRLTVACNQLADVPEDISALENLESLDAHQNRISRVAAGLLQLANTLVVLDLSHNALKGQLAAATCLPLLKVLRCNHNELTSLPPEVLNMQHLEELVSATMP